VSKAGTALTGRSAISILLAALALAAVAAAPAFAYHGGNDPGIRHVLFVGNNWDGTADVIRPRGDFDRIARINVVPDIEQRMLEVATNPVRLGWFLGIREVVAEGNDQFVDDMFSSRDGRLLVVSRPSLADVVAINLRTGKLAWRFEVAGERSDHMAISPNGRHIAVSANTENLVHILKTRTGEEVGTFPSGDTPHENNYSDDGDLIYHGSIGLVYTPADQPLLDTTKGERYFQIVDAKTLDVIKRIDMGEKLEEAGYPNMSSAVRPMALSPDERFVYFQVSFFHGFVEYDLEQNRVTRVANLPIPEHIQETPREQYILDSAHHGIAMNPRGTRLCVAGTMSDYAAIVSRETFRYTLIHGGERPYWSTNSGNGRFCFVSWSYSDRISAISYRKKKEVASIPVGNHPQRMRMGNVRKSWIKANRGATANPDIPPADGLTGNVPLIDLPE
jgi:DNA-binding beta-propeller fold protein YncE